MGYLGTNMDQWTIPILPKPFWFLSLGFTCNRFSGNRFYKWKKLIVWKDDKNPEEQKEFNIHHFWETTYLHCKKKKMNDFKSK